MTEAYICDYVRTPIGSYGGALSGVRADDLAAIPIKALIDRNAAVDWAELDDVILGCANQAGEDNRNLARMAGLLAGLPDSSGGVTLNRLCGSGLDAVAMAARAIRGGDADLIIAGGSRKHEPRAVRHAQGAKRLRPHCGDLRHHHRLALRQSEDARCLRRRHHAEHGGECRRRVQCQPRGPGRLRAAQPGKDRRRAGQRPPRRGDRRGRDPAAQGRSAAWSSKDEHPRLTGLDKLAALKPIVRKDGTVTAGNASGVNDGAAALIIACEEAAKRNGLTPRARVLGGAVAGVPPRIMGIGPAPASQKLLKRLGIGFDQIDVIELNEAFAAQGLAVLRQLGIADDDARVNPNGGAIALGHPLGMSGARLAGTAAVELERTGGRYALATMCIGVGQGIALAMERV